MAAAQDQRGIAIRIIGDDLDEDPDDVSDNLERVIAELSLSPSDVDLLLDLGPVQGNVAVVGGSRLLVSLLRGVARLSEYRSVTVASGAFPVDLSGVGPWTLGEHPRDDAALYNRIRQRPLPRMIDFGDYAVAHPLLTTGVAFSPPPQLRYTVSDRWLTMKARRNDPRGNDQFFDVCAVIAQHPDFCGADLGSADARIAEGRSGGHGPGNATTWRTIGTTHHIDLVVSRLTTLGEP